MRAGFADPVFDAQAVFRAVLGALARPGLPKTLPPPTLGSAGLAPPGPLTAELAAVALALADGGAPLWLDEALRGSPAVADYLRFHTGAPVVDAPAAAAFALIGDPSRCPPFEAFALGVGDYPDRSTTLVMAIDGFDVGASRELAGPGVKGRVWLRAGPLPADWPDRLAANHALFPRGVDVLLVGGGQIVGLPRSTAILLPDATLAEAA